MKQISRLVVCGQKQNYLLCSALTLNFFTELFCEVSYKCY